MEGGFDMTGIAYKTMQQPQAAPCWVLALNDLSPFNGEAALSNALIRQSLFYPLASVDIFGQQPVFIQ